jgi:hypothetical protein
MKKHLILWALLFCFLGIDSSASAQEQKCEGPTELCAQIIDLKAKIEAQKALSEKEASEKTEADKAKEKKRAEDMEKMVALAATIAVVLKTLLSALKGWSSYFTTDKGKAWLKVTTLVVGFAAFFATNIGLGIPWWGALIAAGGGPGAILVHELMKLFPVMLGKAPLPDDEKDESSSRKPPSAPPIS